MYGMAENAYTVSDGELVITLHEAAEGGFIVTTPLDTAVRTEGPWPSERAALRWHSERIKHHLLVIY